MNYKVCYAMKRYVTPFIEGYTIGSKNIINVAREKGIKSDVFSVEPINFHERSSVYAFPGIFAEKYHISDILSATFFSIFSKLNEYDIIHFLPNIAGDIYSLFLLPEIKEKTKIIGHFSHPYHPYITSPFSKFRLTHLSHKAFDYIFCINDFLVNYFKQNTRIKSSNIFKVPFPINTDKYSPNNNTEKIRENYGFSNDDIILACIGQIEPVRGSFITLDAFKNIHKKINNIKLIFSSPGLSFEYYHQNLLRKKINDYNLNKEVFFLPPQVNIEELYNLSDIILFPYIHPYYYMDPPFTLLEAMSCGKIIIASDVGVMSDLIIHEENGLLVKPNDVKSLSKKIHFTINNIDKYKNLGHNARDTIISTYSMNLIGKKLHEIYNKIIS